MNNDSKKRVGLFRNNFLQYSETFIHDELRHHERYDATVFARQWRNRAQFPGHEVEAIEKIPENRRPFASLWYGLTGRSRAFFSKIENGQFDLLHAHFGHNGLYALPYARAFNLPLVVSLHGKDVSVLIGNDKYHPGYWKYLLGYRSLFKEACLFSAASTELKDLIVSVGCPASKVVVNRLGIDLDMFNRSPKSSGSQEKPVVLMVGRFIEKKGHEYAIRAAAMVRDKGVSFELVLAGDGPLKESCENLVETLKMQQHVRFVGSLPHSEISNLMQNATVVIAPSVVAKNLDRESGIIVLKEAAACGIPAIGTIHGGIPDIIDHGVTGFLVAEREVILLGSYIEKLLCTESLRATMGIAAREKMEKEYDIRECVRRLEGLYDEAIARHAITQ